MENQTLISKDFVTKKGKRVQIKMIMTGGCRFETSISINNIMVSDNTSFAPVLIGDPIIPHIEDIDKITAANNKLIEATEYVKNIFQE